MSPPMIQYPVTPLGRQLRVIQWGLEGPAVVLLHGLGSRAEIWGRFASLVAAQGYRCLAVDSPGHGLSWKGKDFDYSAQGHVPLLEALCDELGEEKIDLLGSSFGGIHAATFTARKPERVRSLGMVGAIGLKAMPPERLAWTATWLGQMDRKSIAARFERSVFDPGLFDEAYVEETYRVNNSAGAADAWAAIGEYYRTAINGDMQSGALAALKGAVPILLLWGKDDPTVSYEGGLEGVAEIPGSVLVGIERTKHMPQVERPRISAEQALRVIKGDPGYRLPVESDSDEADSEEPAYEVIRHEEAKAQAALRRA